MFITTICYDLVKRFVVRKCIQKENLFITTICYDLVMRFVVINNLGCHLESLGFNCWKIGNKNLWLTTKVIYSCILSLRIVPFKSKGMVEMDKYYSSVMHWKLLCHFFPLVALGQASRPLMSHETIIWSRAICCDPFDTSLDGFLIVSTPPLVHVQVCYVYATWIILIQHS